LKISSFPSPKIVYSHPSKKADLMAAIGKIREQSTLLLIVIGGAMVAFVLGDIFSGRGTAPADQYVGQVYGEEINMLDYERRVEAQKQSMASVGQPVSTQAEQQIRNQVWNNMVQEKIMYNELNSLGMRLSQDEFDDIRFGQNVRPEFASDENFVNQETGQFDPKLVQNYFSFLNDQYPLFYENQVNRIVSERLYEKYNNMVKKGMYANTIEGKDAYLSQENKVRMNFVVKTFDSVVDSTIEVTDAELKSYFNKHKDEDRFEREAVATLKIVAFDVLPTEEDKQLIREELEDLKGEFGNTKNDSLFVLKYSNSRNAVARQLDTQGNSELQGLIDAANEGDVIGPYEANGRFAIAKIKSVGTEEQATSRHILLSKNESTNITELKSKADSIKKVIQSKNNFEEMVALFSEDPGSQATGGKYEWFNRQMMVPEFTEASFDKPIGSINIIETDYGVHIVEPLDKRDGRIVTVLEVDSRIQPSNQTFNKVYDEANEFSISSENLKGLEALAEERGYNVQEAKNLKRQTLNLPGIQRSTDAVRWAHNEENTKVGSVSEPFEFGTKIVVVALADRKPDGRATFEDVVDEIKPEVIKEKKAEMFKAEMAGKSMDVLTGEMGLRKQVAASVSEARPNLPGGGNEPYVVGYALSLPEGALSEPVEGNKGVYVLEVLAKTAAEPRDEYFTYMDELEEKRKAKVNTYTTGVYSALKDAANVKDERSKVY
jgi:peptidyl-prolyl cis-trans isomerase D